MKIVDRYIAKTVLQSTLLALLILAALDSFFALVGEIGDIGQGDYGIVQAMQYIVLTLPGRLHELFPMAALLGCLMGLGALASNNELVVLRASGMSIARLIRSVAQAGLVLLVAAALLGEYLAPVSEQLAQTQRALAMTRQIVMKSAYGFWARDGKRFVNIQRILPQSHLGGISIYEFDTRNRLVSSTYAAMAHYQDGQWVLEDIQQSLISAQGVTTRHIAHSVWPSLLTPKLLSVVTVRPEDLSARDLYKYIAYLRGNQLDTQRFEQAFWARLIEPLAGMVMLILAVPFAFGPLRRVGAGQRILVGVMVGLAFFLINQTTGQIGQVYSLNPLLSAALPTLLFFALGLVLLRRVR